MTRPMEPLRNIRPGGGGQPQPQPRGPRVPRTEPRTDATDAAWDPSTPGTSSGGTTVAEPPTARLWPGDAGSLPAPARRALAALVRGPHLSAARDEATWRDLLTHADAVRTRLADMYLDLVLDHDDQVAYLRDADAPDAPAVVREIQLTFTDTVLLLHLRTRLLEAPGGHVTADLDAVVDHLRPFRRRSSPDGGGLDGAGFDAGVVSGWKRLIAAGLLLPVDDDERRCVISPVLRTLFGAEEIQAVQTEYARLSREAL